MTEYPSATNLLQKTLTFEIKLFIECKYIVESVGLHTRPSNKEKSEKALLSLNAYSKICQH